MGADSPEGAKVGLNSAICILLPAPKYQDICTHKVISRAEQNRTRRGGKRQDDNIKELYPSGHDRCAVLYMLYVYNWRRQNRTTPSRREHEEPHEPAREASGGEKWGIL